MQTMPKTFSPSSWERSSSRVASSSRTTHYTPRSTCDLGLRADQPASRRGCNSSRGFVLRKDPAHRVANPASRHFINVGQEPCERPNLKRKPRGFVDVRTKENNRGKSIGARVPEASVAQDREGALDLREGKRARREWVHRLLRREEISCCGKRRPRPRVLRHCPPANECKPTVPIEALTNIGEGELGIGKEHHAEA